MSKTNSKALDGSGKSLYEIQHEGIDVLGDKYTAVANAAVVATLFGNEGMYIVKDTTTEDTAIISVIDTAGTYSAVKTAGPTAITIAKDTASSVNVYMEDDVLKVQNLTGGAIDLVIKSYA